MNERTNTYGQPIGPRLAQWSERSRPRRDARLPGRYSRLEAVEERHAEDLFDAFREAPDDRDWTYLFAERPATLGEFQDYLQKLITSQDALHYAIVDMTSAKALGTAALMRIEPTHGVIEVGSITYSPRLQRTRVATEAMYLLMRSVFDDLGYRRYEWKCDSLNSPSRSAAERYGFTFEGIFRQAVVYKGRSRDTAWYSIVAEEWPRVRSAFCEWLEADNFDSLGHQKRTLAAIRTSSSAGLAKLGPSY